jgi:hypothetical protein
MDPISFQESCSASHPLDERIERGFANAKASIIECTDWLTAKEVLRLSGEIDSHRGEDRIRDWRAHGKIFSLRLDDGVERYPSYGFNQFGRPHDVLKEILTHLGPINAWRIAAWFNSNTLLLGGRAPRELLESDPEAVLRVAKDYHG